MKTELQRGHNLQSHQYGEDRSAPESGALGLPVHLHSSQPKIVKITFLHRVSGAHPQGQGEELRHPKGVPN